jgi:hypothetical protein
VHVRKVYSPNLVEKLSYESKKGSEEALILPLYASQWCDRDATQHLIGQFQEMNSRKFRKIRSRHSFERHAVLLKVAYHAATHTHCEKRVSARFTQRARRQHVYGLR